MTRSNTPRPKPSASLPRLAAHRRGQQAERQALDWLRAQGHVLVMQNFRCKGGEIDLIVLDHDTLAIIEVRARKSRAFGGAAGSVTHTKQRRIIHATRHFLVQHPQHAQRPIRFDVLAYESTQPPQWLRAAFDASGD